MKTPARLRSLVARFGVLLAVLLVALVLPKPAHPEDPAATTPDATPASPRKGDAQASPPADRCHPLAGEDQQICKQLVELEVRDVIPLQELQTHAVVLVSRDGKMLLPIFVDEAAAVSIAFRLAHREPPHPLAQDLLDEVVTKMGGKVTSVRIDDLEDDIFVGRLVIRHGEKDLALDARPSDSIAMALKGNAPILATRKVMDAAGIDEKEINEMLEQQPGVGGGGLPPGHPAVPPGPGAEELPPPGPEPDKPTIEL